MIKKIIHISLLALVFIGITLAIIYSISVAAKSQLDAIERGKIGGQYITIDDGVISYNVSGPGSGEPVVLVHGLSTPKFVWNATTAALSEAGYRVYSFDHLGRGFSDRPKTDYNRAFYVRELAQLLDGLGLTAPATLIGYSMGGANIIDFTNAFPERVKELILIAPAGFIPVDENLKRFIELPFISDALSPIIIKRYALAGIEKHVATGAAPASMITDFERQYTYTGYSQAILSTLRHYQMSGLDEEYAAVGELGIKVSALWGTEDKVVPFAASAKVQRLIPQLQLYPFDGADHSITFAKADQVNQQLLAILAQ
jgi:pimeloyl-ACP methyl ester carboxylesterase